MNWFVTYRTVTNITAFWRMMVSKRANNVSPWWLDFLFSPLYGEWWDVISYWLVFFHFADILTWTHLFYFALRKAKIFEHFTCISFKATISYHTPWILQRAMFQFCVQMGAKWWDAQRAFFFYYENYAFPLLTF
jgi:hypothetical protein